MGHGLLLLSRCKIVNGQKRSFASDQPGITRCCLENPKGIEIQGGDIGSILDKQKIIV
jgi:hypothetical protein